MKMMLRPVLCLAILGGVLCACEPLIQTVQTAVANTPSFIPTFTPVPAGTSIPCTSRGWQEISNDLREFNQRRASVAANNGAYLQGMKDTAARVDAVEIDQCSEPAYHLIEQGLAYQIYGNEIILTAGEAQQGEFTIIRDQQFIAIAKKELQAVGIALQYH